ncbi:MAG: type II toxin-antitoxin system RelE/ParE family toxin [Lentilactobacillus diolivorans]|uniref:type II toxin-antitoxin system RelE/ParE family toxin n=1 Tax=Lentilactobacillus diolivorans TaxID=179838 RepID=UPI0039EBC343
MKVFAETNKLSKALASQKKLLKEFGRNRAHKIQARITEFKAANDLSEISYLPPARLHELSGNRKGYFAVDISGNWRIVFKALDRNSHFTTVKEDAVAVYIKEVVDYHGN